MAFAVSVEPVNATPATRGSATMRAPTLAPSPDSISEVREAVDFLRYYADRARAEFGPGLRLPGPTGESNELRLRGRGVFVCISPWNFPLAIFTGQIAAARPLPANTGWRASR